MLMTEADILQSTDIFLMTNDLQRKKCGWIYSNERERGYASTPFCQFELYYYQDQITKRLQFVKSAS